MLALPSTCNGVATHDTLICTMLVGTYELFEDPLSEMRITGLCMDRCARICCGWVLVCRKGTAKASFSCSPIAGANQMQDHFVTGPSYKKLEWRFLSQVACPLQLSELAVCLANMRGRTSWPEVTLRVGGSPGRPARKDFGHCRSAGRVSATWPGADRPASGTPVCSSLGRL